MSSSNSYAVIDLETTGLDCWSDLITEIGVMVITPDAPPGAEAVLVKIDRPLPDAIVRLTGITDQLLARQGIPIDDALLWFKAGNSAHRAANDVIVTQQLFEKMRQVHPPESFLLGGKYAI